MTRRTIRCGPRSNARWRRRSGSIAGSEITPRGWRKGANRICSSSSTSRARLAGRSTSASSSSPRPSQNAATRATTSFGWTRTTRTARCSRRTTTTPWSSDSIGSRRSSPCSAIPSRGSSPPTNSPWRFPCVRSATTCKPTTRGGSARGRCGRGSTSCGTSTETCARTRNAWTRMGERGPSPTCTTTRSTPLCTSSSSSPWRTMTYTTDSSCSSWD
mmetsp:Transcript_17/g.92  ORF Transcript_17/g.92 Transcript_17/m.92 type:complete len:216 (+) Transcript_17:660-1307(+)